MNQLIGKQLRFCLHSVEIVHCVIGWIRPQPIVFFQRIDRLWHHIMLMNDKAALESTLKQGDESKWHPKTKTVK